MGHWPEFDVLERDGKLIVGRSPEVRRGNRVGLGAALVFGVPLVLYFVWIGVGPPTWTMAVAGGLSVAGGLWSFVSALTGSFDLDERRDLVFDAPGDRVVRGGKVVCALREVVTVELKASMVGHNVETDQPAASPAELVLFMRREDSPSRGRERVVLFKGGDSDLYVPAGRIQAYLESALPPYAARVG